MQQVAFGSMDIKLSTGETKSVPGSFRYSGLGRTKFLEAASLAAKGDLKQLGALDAVSEFCGRMQFEQLREIARELATLCPSACGGSMLDAVLKRIDAVEVHIKRDLKAHLSHEDASACAWHCANHAHAHLASADGTPPDGSRPAPCMHDHTHGCAECSQLAALQQDMTLMLTAAEAALRTALPPLAAWLTPLRLRGGRRHGRGARLFPSNDGRWSNTRRRTSTITRSSS